jgi:hypothetical protein
MKKYILSLGLYVSLNLHAQTGIGTTTPNASAKLDVTATNKGFLPPRVSLTSSTDAITIASPATGLLVFCKGDAGLAAGYYFWNGAVWATIATAGGSGNVAAEYGTDYLASLVSVTGLTPVDVVSFTLPSAGTWEIISFVRSQGTPGFIGGYAIYDAAGNIVTNSEILSAYGPSAATASGVIRVQTTGASTYKLKSWASYGSYSVMTNGDGKTGVSWKKISGNTPMTIINYGDVKTGFQSADHNGWVKLDGRAKSTLSSTQQAQATALGIGTNLPDATNAVLMQSSGTIGSITGSMSTTIAQNQLPNISPSITVNSTVATMQDAGSHDHPVNVVPNSTGGYAAGNPYAFKTGVAPNPMNESYADITDRGNSASLITTGIIGSSGNHNHIINSHGHTATSSSINGGVTQQAIDITPRRMIVNSFIYLGY